MKRAVIMADGKLVTAEDLDLEAEAHDGLPVNIKAAREEADAVPFVRRWCGGTTFRHSELLGIGRPTLYD